MDFSPALALAGLFVGFLVGLTGMGGGALMTPLLVLFFNVPAFAAVSSDLVVSLLMKPAAATVHARRGEVNWRIVSWLMLGSIPAAFSGVFVMRALGSGEAMQHAIKVLLGWTLLVAAASMLVRRVLTSRRTESIAKEPLTVRPLATLIIGITGGLVVGMTSVGSGSLIIVALMLLYPRLTGSGIVGTDLVQAVPLVGAAALGHLLFGEFSMTVATSLLVGALPGAYLGARTCMYANDAIVRSVIGVVLVASALKLLDVSNQLTLAIVAVIVLAELVPIVRTRQMVRNEARSV
jgi:uncharacterized membrane protein YfcA